MELKDLSIRARVGMSTLCLEKLLNDNFSEEVLHKGWEYILSSIWEYTEKSPGNWHYKMAEITPFSVEEDLPFEEKGIEYLDREIYFLIADAYKDTCGDIKRVVDLIFEIGTLDLYSSIVDNSPRTLSMLEEILTIAENNGLRIPSIDIFKDYQITTNNGWGNSFKRSDVVNDDDLLSPP